MKLNKVVCSFAAVLILSGICVQAQEESSGAVRVVSKTDKDAMVSMTFDETPLSDVIKAFRDATGANIISSGTNLQQSVSVRLDNVPWQKGLTSILEPQGLQLVEKPVGSGIYLVNKQTLDIPTVTKTFQIANARVTDVEELLTAVLGDKGKVTAFPSSNTIIINAPEKEQAECEIIIEAIDAPRKQVYIEARFVEMTASAGKELGLRWDTLGGEGWGMSFDGASLGYVNEQSSLARKGTGGIGDIAQTTTDPVSGDTSSFSGTQRGRINESLDTYSRSHIFTGSLTLSELKLALNAFEQNDGVSVFSNPKVIVANEERAKIDMTTKEPNIEVDYQAATTEGMRDSVSTKLALIPGEEEPFVGEAFFSYGIALEVTPRISSSGLITVSIEPSISERIGYFDVQGLDEKMPASRFPIIDMKRIQTVFTMDSGRTAVIGGLSRTYDANLDSGIPFLKNIPWIGPRLFGWKGRQKEQTEIVIFVTVGIADPLTIEEDAGMPRNAILSRDVMTGRTKEPYRFTREEMKPFTDKFSTPPADDNEENALEEQEAAPPQPESVTEAAQSSAAPVAAPESSEQVAEIQPLLAN